MIRVTSISNTESDGNVVKISAFADTKDEVVSGAKFVGLDDDAVIDMGSSIITAAGDLAFMKSDGTWSWVSSGGGSGKLYTNSKVYESEAQITDVTGFTKVYNSSIRYGNNGAKVSARLDVTDESAIETFMRGGWDASGMPYYNAENLIGAYGGYDFGEELFISKVRLWIGRYIGQNTSLNVTLQWLDENGDWNDILQDLQVTTALSYPVNVFERLINLSCYGIRWIHKHTPNKTGGNNITFAGMTIYEGIGESIDVYVPTQTGLIPVPTGYDGFGPLYIAP